MQIAIVGGGVAGCYCAYRLRHALPDAEVTLFEASDRVGGRLWSVAMAGVANGLAEMGGMFFGSMQANVSSLVTGELKLRTAQVNWDRRSQFLRGCYLDDHAYEDPAKHIPFNLRTPEQGRAPGTLLMDALVAIVPTFEELWPMTIAGPDVSPQATMAYLQAFQHNGRHLWQWGFWNLLAEVVSNEAYQLLLATMGTATAFRNTNALDAVWTFLHEMAPTQDYFRLTDGYQALPIALADGARTEGRLRLEHSLQGVRRRGQRFRLAFETPNGDRKIEADKVILALPRRALELIDMDAAIVGDEDDWRRRLEVVTPAHACKVFLAFDQPWWDGSMYGPTALGPNDVSVSFTDLPMRQCYYWGGAPGNATSLIMATYADDVATEFWSGLRDPSYCEIRPARPGRGALCTSLAMEEAARQQLAAMHPDVTVPAPTDGVFMDWSDDPYGGAWHAWAPYQKSWEAARAMEQPNPELDLFICGEAFSMQQGWVEGALNTAECVLRRVGAPRPAWVDPTYDFNL